MKYLFLFMDSIAMQSKHIMNKKLAVYRRKHFKLNNLGYLLDGELVYAACIGLTFLLLLLL